MFVYRSILLIFGCAITMLTLNAFAAEDIGDKAYVDMSKVFKNYHKTAKQQKALKRQEEVYNEKAEEMGSKLQDLQKKQKNLEEKARNVALSKDVRNQHEQKAKAVESRFQAKQKELRNYLEEKQQELRKRYMNIRKDIVDEITEDIHSYADENEIQVVFDVSGLTNNLLPVVIHYPESKEITQEIIDQLNKGHEKPDDPAEVGAPEIKESVE